MKPEELFHIADGGVVTRLRSDEEPYDTRAHDVKNALRAFDTFVGSLKQGYRMDDANAPLYLARLESALAELSGEVKFWQALYKR